MNALLFHTQTEVYKSKIGVNNAAHMFETLRQSNKKKRKSYDLG